MPTPGGVTPGPRTFDPAVDMEQRDKDNAHFPRLGDMSLGNKALGNKLFKGGVGRGVPVARGVGRGVGRGGEGTGRGGEGATTFLGRDRRQNQGN